VGRKTLNGVLGSTTIETTGYTSQQEPQQALMEPLVVCVKAEVA